MRLIVLLLIGLVTTGCDRQKPEAPQAPAGEAAATSAAETGKGLDRSRIGKPAPATAFKDPSGKDVTIAGFKGQPVLVNLWATWCAPCVKELPTLAALEADQRGKLAVIAVSQDMGERAAVDTFLAGKKLGRFAAYHDADMALSTDLGAQVLPTTVLYDAAGKEIWRYVGDMDWNGAEARRLVTEAISPAAAR